MHICLEKILEYHKGGKVAVKLTKPLKNASDLSMAYTPGVAEPVKVIAKEQLKSLIYTARSNLVAVVSDGTAILGLGDLGATASIPVMEGKACLFKAFADVDAWPVPLENCRVGGKRTGRTDVNLVVDTVARLACMYGGINLEDIAAPDCFEIEEKLDNLLDIPVFHDDQWGTAIITLAGVLNYCIVSSKKIKNLSIVINGAGAAGIRIADMLTGAGAKNIVMCDSKGVIHSARDNLNNMKRRYAVETKERTLIDAMRGADVFIGVSAAKCVSKSMVLSMSQFPAIFAMANPAPEIMPEEVSEALGKKPYVMATGRSDYPNQINNVLGFPFIFRGALDVQATTINIEMKCAAAYALAELARKKVPEDIKAIYKNKKIEFGMDYIVPKPFDSRLIIDIPMAVAKAAKKSGVARKELDEKTLLKELKNRQKAVIALRS
jgi:malate dehydrogenase (oxaloacetate-decarboxylating)(NADP+)